MVLTGCAVPGNQVTFFTKTSLGIDVESTPPGVGIAYDRAEGYIGPRYDNGTVPPIAGFFSTDGGLLNRQINQVYATGNAAKTVTKSPNAVMATPEQFEGDHKMMFFGTGTVLGLKLAFGTGGLVESFTLGYKRKELSVIPVANGNFPSVLASVDNNVQVDRPSEGRLKIEQFFATGAAADALSRRPIIQNAFTGQAQIALAEYREDERQQRRLALDILYCLAKLDDSQLLKVWRNAETVKLFDDNAIPAKLNAVSAHDARALYTSELGLIDAASKEKTGLMRGHWAYVCELAGK